MPQEIYNEGRVVGLSAWELFKRQALSTGVPEDAIPNEHQWLTAMIGAGSSMVLKISADDPVLSKKGVHDFELPENSNLSAAGVVVANPFIGECEWDDTPNYPTWAKKVSSYGPLILNDLASSPTTSNVPFSNTYPVKVKTTLGEFLKITDGIVYTKRATWIARSVNSTASFVGDGETTSFPFGTQENPQNVIEILSVTINEEVEPESNYSLDIEHIPNAIVFNTAPADDSAITITYKRVSDGDPAKDINPDFNDSTTVVRLYLDSDITHDVYILFTGFANKRILQGVSGFATENEGFSIGGSTDTDHNDWQNGGMLGPEIFPWASRIVFSVPSSVYNLVNSLIRTIPLDNQGEVPQYVIPDNGLEFDGIVIKKNSIDSAVKPNSLIDFNSINLIDYYSNHAFQSNPVLQESATDVVLGGGDSLNEIVAWYPGMDASKIADEIERSPRTNDNFFPPAMYAAQITQSGTQTLVPLDIAAPGTVKGFTNSTQAYNYKELMKNNFALYHDVRNNTIAFVIPGEPDPDKWLGLAKLEYISPAPKVQLLVGSKSAQLVALTDPNGVPYDLTGSKADDPTSPDYVAPIPVGPANDLTWAAMLNGLAQETKINVLGNDLHNVGNELYAHHSIGIDNNVAKSGANALSLTSSQRTKGFTGDGVQTVFNFGTQAQPEYVSYITSVTIDGDTVDVADYSLDNTQLPNTITFAEAPADTSAIVVNYGAELIRITSSQNMIDPNSTLATFSAGTSLKSGTEFIEFSNGLRLYISNTTGGPNPATVPEGSIGIGWVDSQS